MADRPSNTGREDTVALPLPANRPASGSNGAASSSTEQSGGPAGGSPGSNGRVLPPMPDQTPGRNGNGVARSETPPPPPPQARAARPAAQKPAAPPAAPPAATQPRPATQAPVARTTETARPVAAPPVVAPVPAKAQPVKEPKPERPTRQDKKAAKAAAAPRASRRARLRLTRIDPWSVMKTSFLLSIALGIVIVVSVLMVWSVLGAADVWSSINKTVRDVLGGQDASTFNIEDYLGTRRVVGFTMIVAAVDVVLVTAICTLGAFLYNMSASLLGGIEVTLAEDR